MFHVVKGSALLSYMIQFWTLRYAFYATGLKYIDDLPDEVYNYADCFKIANDFFLLV